MTAQWEFGWILLRLTGATATPRVNRGEIFSDDEIQVFPLVNRGLRGTYLCGRADQTARDYSHRKQWIRDRREVLAGIFAVDVLSFAVMSNLLHVVAPTRPDLVKAWSDEEVALRWSNMFPQRRRKDRSPEERTEFELNQIRNDASSLKEKRKRLSNVSWFIKRLKAHGTDVVIISGVLESVTLSDVKSNQ